MSANIPECLSLKEMAKATGFVVTTNASAQPTLFCWFTTSGEYLYLPTSAPSVGERPISAHSETISKCDPITAISGEDFYIEELLCVRNKEGDVIL